MEFYDESIKNPPVKKLGWRPESDTNFEGYSGGWVWKTAEEAEEFRKLRLEEVTEWNPADFAVYSLELNGDWESDVFEHPDPEDGVHRLAVDAVVVERVKI